MDERSNGLGPVRFFVTETHLDERKMESEVTRQANNIIAPTASTEPGTGITSLTTSTSAAAVDLWDSNTKPRPALYNRYLDLMADGGDIYVLFSTASTPAIDQTVGSTTLAAGTTAAVPWLLKDGVPVPVRLMSTDIRFLHTKASSGTPKLRIRPSSQPAFTLGT